MVVPVRKDPPLTKQEILLRQKVQQDKTFDHSEGCFLLALRELRTTVLAVKDCTVNMQECEKPN